MSFWLHPEAEAELGDAAVYYAEHASRVVASSFVNEFERVVALLSANQGMGTPSGDGLRTYPFRRFPYLLVYREDAAGPRVFAVAHQHREPRYWEARS